MNDKELILDLYKHVIDLHKGYLDLAVKLTIAYYAITGAIVSFYFSKPELESMTKWSLLLPILFSFLLFYFFVDSARSSTVSQKYVEELAEKLGITTFSTIVITLQQLLCIFSILFLITGIGLLVAIFKDCLF